MILQYYEILKYHRLSKVKQQFMAYRQQQFYDLIFSLCCDKTYGAMTKYDDRDDDEDNDGNEDGNDDDNAAVGLGSDRPIFHPITAPWSRLGLAEEDRAMTTTEMWPRRTIYLCIGI